MPYDAELAKKVIDAIRSKPYIVYGPRVIILRDKPEDTTKGGLVVPDQAQRTKKSGTVVGMGAGYNEATAKEFNVYPLEVGHRVTFNAYDGVEHLIPVDGKHVPVLGMHIANLYFGWEHKTGGSQNGSE